MATHKFSWNFPFTYVQFQCLLVTNFYASRRTVTNYQTKNFISVFDNFIATNFSNPVIAIVVITVAIIVAGIIINIATTMIVTITVAILMNHMIVVAKIKAKVIIIVTVFS